MTPCETWARAERVENLENNLGEIQSGLDRLNQRFEWMERELLLQKPVPETPSERICQHCKWGEAIPGATQYANCHYSPHSIYTPLNWYCSKWCSND